MGYFVAISHLYAGLFRCQALKALQIIMTNDNLGANVKLRCIRTKENVFYLLLAGNSIVDK